MLGALDVPARMSPSPAWFALTGTAPALLAAAAAMCGPEAPGVAGRLVPELSLGPPGATRPGAAG